jgi:hypothetical protein
MFLLSISFWGKVETLELSPCWINKTTQSLSIGVMLKMSNLGSKFRLTATALSIIGLCSPAVSSADAGTLQFSQATFDVYEGDGTVLIEVTRTDGDEGNISVHYATSDGTATAGADYRAKSRVQRFG